MKPHGKQDMLDVALSNKYRSLPKVDRGSYSKRKIKKISYFNFGFGGPKVKKVKLNYGRNK